MESTTTGIKTLDDLLLNGIPMGYTVLVVGSPESGMEIFAKQFCSAKTSRNEVSVFFSTIEHEDTIQAIIKMYGWNDKIKIVSFGTEHYESVIVKEIESHKLRHEGISMRDLTNAPDIYTHSNVTNYLSKLTYEISKLKSPYRVVVDSLDFFFEQYQSENVLKTIRRIKNYVHHDKGVVLFTLHRGILPESVQNRLEGIIDCVIDLKVRIEDSSMKKIMFIKKLRNYPHKTKILYYKITEKGIEIKGKK